MGKVAVNGTTGIGYRSCYDDEMGQSDLRCVSLPGSTLRQAKKRYGVAIDLLLTGRSAMYDTPRIYSYAPFSIYKSRCGYDTRIPDPCTYCFDNQRTGHPLAVPLADSSRNFVCCIQTPAMAQYAIRNCTDREEG